MYDMIDSEFFISCFFFIVCVIVLNFWLINLFVAVITNTFSAIRSDTKKSAFGAAPWVLSFNLRCMICECLFVGLDRFSLTKMAIGIHFMVTLHIILVSSGYGTRRPSGFGSCLLCRLWCCKLPDLRSPRIPTYSFLCTAKLHWHSYSTSTSFGGSWDFYRDGGHSLTMATIGWILFWPLGAASSRFQSFATLRSTVGWLSSN